MGRRISLSFWYKSCGTAWPGARRHPGLTLGGPGLAGGSESEPAGPGPGVAVTRDGHARQRVSVPSRSEHGHGHRDVATKNTLMVGTASVRINREHWHVTKNTL
jgi:hypothetical protein